MVITTLEKLQKDKCFCMKASKDIPIQDCILFDCNRWKKCMTKTNNDIKKEGKNGSQKKKRQQEKKKGKRNK